jgi:uncharacterized repeat protein (TIGR01451 family)
MAPFFPNAGAGPKITMKFKAKIFSFADIVVNGNALTLYQITEPLQATSSASATNPAPFGTDFFGKPLNDPIADTQLDPQTGAVLTPAADGTPGLLDKFTVTRPPADLSVQLVAPVSAVPGAELTYSINITNLSRYPLNGVQAVLSLPTGVDYTGDLNEGITLQNQNNVVVTIGHLASGESQTVALQAAVDENLSSGVNLAASATVRSSTAQPVNSNSVNTLVTAFSGQ